MTAHRNASVEIDLGPGRMEGDFTVPLQRKAPWEESSGISQCTAWTWSYSSASGHTSLQTVCVLPACKGVLHGRAERVAGTGAWPQVFGAERFRMLQEQAKEQPGAERIASVLTRYQHRTCVSTRDDADLLVGAEVDGFTIAKAPAQVADASLNLRS